MNAPTVDPAPADQLLVRINTAVAAVNEAEEIVATAEEEVLSRCRAVGMLLLEAKKLHPAVKDFKAFLERVDGLKLSRAYDLMRLVGGRTTDEELRKDARERQQKSRNKKKPPKPAPVKEPEPNPVSVTDPHVTETDEESAEKRGADHSTEKAANVSADALAQFDYACRHWLPKMTEADQHKALQLVTDLVNPKAEAA